MKASGLLLAIGWAMFALQIGLTIAGVSIEVAASIFAASQVYFAASIVCTEIEKRNNRTND